MVGGMMVCGIMVLGMMVDGMMAPGMEPGIRHLVMVVEQWTISGGIWINGTGIMVYQTRQ
jgi:hypothetical protein